MAPELVNSPPRMEAEKADTSRLAEKLQSVPQGIFELIFDLTFAADRSVKTVADGTPIATLPDDEAGVQIDHHNRPPTSLRMPAASLPIAFNTRSRTSRRSANRCYDGREQSARSYYSNTVFTFRCRELLIRWLRSLPSAHREMLREVRYNYRQGRSSIDPLGRWNVRAESELKDL